MSLEQIELPLTHPRQPRAKPEVRYKDWVVPYWLLRGTSVHAIDKMRAAPKHEFRRFYLGQMQAYFDEDRAAGRPLRTCYDGCKKEIPSARHLRRVFGRDLCAKCFKAQYPKRREEMDESSRAYFDLVAAI